MKVLMERLASGNVSYEIADALISENKITVELDADETIEGDIAIVGKNSMDIGSADILRILQTAILCLDTISLTV